MAEVFLWLAAYLLVGFVFSSVLYYLEVRDSPNDDYVSSPVLLFAVLWPLLIIAMLWMSYLGFIENFAKKNRKRKQ